jgi:carbonic anhydrase
MIEKLLEGHQTFHKRFVAGEREFVRALASPTQHPSGLYVGCSDSRIVPELLLGANPGELFVVRNVANLVPTFEHADASVGAALEYAVAYLHVPHIIVCGHYGCGGVKAALDGLDGVAHLASLHEWLAGAQPGAARARERGLEGDVGWRAAVEENVVEQVANLPTYPAVAAALEAGTVMLHGWAFDPVSLQLSVYDVENDTFVRADELMK